MSEIDQELELTKQKKEKAEKVKNLLSETKTKSNSIRIGDSLFRLLSKEAKKSGLSVVEYQRQVLAQDVVGIQVADRIEERIESMNETLKFMRSRVDASIAKYEKEISYTIDGLVNIVKDIVDTSKKANIKRDAEYAKIANDLIDLTTIMTHYFSKIADERSGSSSQIPLSKEQFSATTRRNNI